MLHYAKVGEIEQVSRINTAYSLAVSPCAIGNSIGQNKKLFIFNQMYVLLGVLYK